MVPVGLQTHPNADALSVVPVFGFTCVVQTEPWRERDRGVYVPVETLVDTARPEFAFLANQARADGRHRVRAIKLRGIFSQGLLLPAPAGAAIGDDCAAYYGVEKWQPPERGVAIARVDDAEAPEVNVVYTDIEHLRRHDTVLHPGEHIVAMEKIHGANARYTWQGGRLHVGTHKRWITLGEPDKPNPWFAPVTAAFCGFCAAHTGLTFFGEVFGAVQDLRYGLGSGFGLRVFDAYDPARGGYLGFAELAHLTGRFTEATGGAVLPAPKVYEGAYDLAVLGEAVERNSLVCPGQLMEGVVVRPLEERWDQRVGRVVLKLVSQRYLLRREEN